MAGLGIFGAASLGCAAAPTLGALAGVLVLPVVRMGSRAVVLVLAAQAELFD